jgi:hypothetical protein
MKTLLLILFVVSCNSFASPKWDETKKYERLNNRIESRAGNISFMLEMDFPNKDDAWYIAYKKCGDTYPVEPRVDVFEEYPDASEKSTGYDVIYHYGEGIRMPYYYKCKEDNGHPRTEKAP